MIYKYRTLDGMTLEADSLQGIAEALWKSKFIPEDNLEAWMESSAERARILNGSLIRTTSPEDHVLDLIDEGFLTPLG